MVCDEATTEDVDARSEFSQSGVRRRRSQNGTEKKKKKKKRGGVWGETAAVCTCEYIQNTHSGAV